MRTIQGIKDKYGYINNVKVSEILHSLGITKSPSAHHPDAGWEIVYNGVTIKCDPKTSDPRRKSSKHRVKFMCFCGEWIPLGRACQHIPACEACDA